MRLVDTLKATRDNSRKMILVPEFNPEGEPLKVYYYPQTPRVMSAGNRLCDEYQLTGNNFGIACSILAVMMLDEQGERLIADADLLPFMEQAPQVLVDRLAEEIGSEFDVEAELEDAKKPSLPSQN